MRCIFVFDKVHYSIVANGNSASDSAVEVLECLAEILDEEKQAEGRAREFGIWKWGDVCKDGGIKGCFSHKCDDRRFQVKWGSVLQWSRQFSK